MLRAQNSYAQNRHAPPRQPQPVKGGLAALTTGSNPYAALTGFAGVVIRTAKDGLYRVQLGPVKEGAALDRLQSVLQAADYGRPRLIPVH